MDLSPERRPDRRRDDERHAGRHAHDHGRTSGRPRTTPLTTLVDGDRWVVIASNSGSPNHPRWFRNLVAHPRVTIEVHRTAIAATARTATAEERALLWPRVTATAKTYAEYQERTAREFPLVIIERA
ncbi:MAG: nitroreductase family deazaflavin-dependent oxidoreductase [Dehalococcoidia bacterium]|nr:nitroreductase family deazaflavin-dependent oxidoreductase [Dehalococcoidia bacterium]